MKSNKTQYITCPFCSLHCDDIKIRSDGKSINVISEPIKNCTNKIEYFNLNKRSNLQAKAKNKYLDIHKSIQTAKSMLDKSNDITVVNHGTDVDGVRSILSFSASYNAVVDHVNSSHLYRNLGIMQRKGYMATSLTETKNRSDLVILFGKNILSKSPRIIDKVIFPKYSLCSSTKKRTLVLIGKFDLKTIRTLKKSHRVENLDIELDRIPGLLGELESGIKKTSMLLKLKNLIKNSKYLVCSWTSSDFDASSNPDHIISSISDFVLKRNEVTRAACMPIAGSLGDTTSSQTMTWITGFPARVKFNGQKFMHDRNICNSKSIIDNKNTDLVVHISTINPDKLQINKNLKNIVIGHPNSTFTYQPDIFIPVGIPGIDHRGIMFRTDHVVSMALDKVRDVGLLSVKEILNNLVRE